MTSCFSFPRVPSSSPNSCTKQPRDSRKERKTGARICRIIERPKSGTVGPRRFRIFWDAETRVSLRKTRFKAEYFLSRGILPVSRALNFPSPGHPLNPRYTERLFGFNYAWLSSIPGRSTVQVSLLTGTGDLHHLATLRLFPYVNGFVEVLKLPSGCILNSG